MDYGVPDDADVRKSDHRRLDVGGAALSARPQPRRPDEITNREAGSPVSVTVIEPKALARECLVEAIRGRSEFHVTAFDSVQQWCAAAEHGDTMPVLLVSVDNALGALNSDEQLLRVFRDEVCPVTVMADDLTPERIAKALQLGARGYIPTSLSLAAMVRALRFVADGGTFIPASSLLDACKDNKRQNGEPACQNSDIFTPRQSAVVQALCLGKPNKVIAYELNMCESTVKVHIRNIMKKLNAKNRTEVVIMAQKLRGPVAVDGSATVTGLPYKSGPEVHPGGVGERDLA